MELLSNYYGKGGEEVCSPKKKNFAIPLRIKVIGLEDGFLKFPPRHENTTVDCNNTEDVDR